MWNGEFKGTTELEFTPDEVNAIRQAEGLPSLRRVQHTRTYAPAPHEGEYGVGMALAVFFVGCVFLLVWGLFIEKPDHPESSATVQVVAQPSPELPRLSPPPAPAPPASVAPSELLAAALAADGAEAATEDVDTENSVSRTTPLPPGWERAVLADDTVIHDFSSRDAPVLGTAQAGNALLLIHLHDCWYLAVAENEDLEGAVCIEKPPQATVRVALGHWRYETMTNGVQALVHKLPGDVVLYIRADGSACGRVSRALP